MEECADLRSENEVLNEQIQFLGACSMDSPGISTPGSPSLADELGDFGGGFGGSPDPNSMRKKAAAAPDSDGAKLGKAPTDSQKVLRLRLSAKWLVAMERKEEARLIRQLILQLKKLTFLEVYIR